MRRRRALRWVLLAAGIILGLVIVTAIGCADRLILPPVPRYVEPDAADRRLLEYADGAMEVFVARSPGAQEQAPEAFVLRFTGDAAGAAVFTASRWKERPVEVWVVNYPGYGGSSGPRTLAAMARQSLAAFDALKEHAGDRPIFLEGFSLGSVPALHVAARRPAAGAIIQNAPPLRELIVGEHGWWNLWLLAWPVALQVPSGFDSIANAGAIAAPCVFLIADHDRTIPAEYQRRIAEAHVGPHLMIVQERADHITPLDAETEAALQQAMDWLLHQDRP